MRVSKWQKIHICGWTISLMEWFTQKSCHHSLVHIIHKDWIVFLGSLTNSVYLLTLIAWNGNHLYSSLFWLRHAFKLWQYHGLWAIIEHQWVLDLIIMSRHRRTQLNMFTRSEIKILDVPTRIYGGFSWRNNNDWCVYDKYAMWMKNVKFMF